MLDEINTSFTLKTGETVDWRLVSFGSATLLSWIVLFACGTLLNSSPYRLKLNAAEVLPFVEGMKTWLIVIASWTITNVALLCCFSSVLGGFYRQFAKRKAAPDALAEHFQVMFFPYLVQGFVVFLLLISGLLLLGESPFKDLSQEKYVRLAGSASLFSFVLGYDPRVFIKLLERAEQIGDHGKKPVV